MPKVSRVTRIVEELEEEYGVSKDWCSDFRNRLKKAKCYLKTKYRVHSRDEDSRCADHCRKFALIDPVDKTSDTSACTTIYQSVTVARNCGGKNQ